MLLVSIGGWIAIGVVAILIVALVALVINVYNKMVKGRNRCKDAFSQIDVQLTRRFDLIPNLVETVKGYAKHETETLEKVIKWRNGIPADATIEQKSEFASSMSKVVSGLNVVVEQYPDLKANDMFGKLQAAIADSEEQLQASRRIYNANVSSINTAIVTFPTSIVAKKINIQKKTFFEAEEVKRSDVKMEF